MTQVDGLGNLSGRGGGLLGKTELKEAYVDIATDGECE